MSCSGAYPTFEEEISFLRLLHRELFVLMSYCIGMMLFRIEFSSHSSINFQHIVSAPGVTVHQHVKEIDNILDFSDSVSV